MEGNKKNNKAVFQTSIFKLILTTKLSPAVAKTFYTNQEYIEKGFATNHTNYCWIKHPKLRQKYALNRMCTCDSQKDLKAHIPKTQSLYQNWRVDNHG